jgi:hypothetical protein
MMIKWLVKILHSRSEASQKIQSEGEGHLRREVHTKFSQYMAIVRGFHGEACKKKLLSFRIQTPTNSWRRKRRYGELMGRHKIFRDGLSAAVAHVGGLILKDNSPK